MKPLRLALIHRAHWYRQEPRIDGQFAYEVPGLTWAHYNVDKEFTFDIQPLKDVDVVWWDDGKYDLARFTPPRGERIAPVVFWALWPTIDQGVFAKRVRLAKGNADLVLVEHDELQRWEDALKVPARRLAYSVNERFYRDRGQVRDVDVGFYCVWQHNPGRPAMNAWLQDFCGRKGWTFGTNGGRGTGTRYAEQLARCKVVVHLARTPNTRPNRLFDVAACGTALLANRLPVVSGEQWQPGVHYVPFDNPQDQFRPGASGTEYGDRECEEVAAGLEWLLDGGHWREVGQAAKQYVLSCHTWAQRSWELRGILLDCFPHLREQAGEEWAYQ